MKKKVFLSTMLLLLAHLLSVPAFAQVDSTDSIALFLRAKMKERGIPGLQVAILRRGQVVYQDAYGVASVQDSLPVHPNTLFFLASMTKAFVGVAILQLVEEHKVQLDAPVSTYLTDLPAAWQPVTIRQLLTHASGLPDVVDHRTGGLLVDADGEATWAKLVTLPIGATPGQRFEYNQTNYVLLGQVIAQTSGMSFGQFIQQRQFNVAGMRHSRFADFADLVPHRAQPYRFRNRLGNDGSRMVRLTNIFSESTPYLLPANGLHSTAGELALWLQALQAGRLLTKESQALLWTPGHYQNGEPGGFGGLLNGYALGWQTVGRSTHSAVASVGASCNALFMYPQDELTIVLLTNLVGAQPESFIDEVAGYYLPDMKAARGFGLPPAIQQLRAQLLKKGFNQALKIVAQLRKKDPAFALSENEVNAWGYQLAQQQQLAQAIAVMRLNVRLYPQSANTYDSLGELLERSNDRHGALLNFQRSLVLNPQNTNAIERIKTLESK